ncbi:TetR/AcrR family transcriptional regulator [Nocardia noduli]|uniref:TetR/AcrR family transcriptional regulator n=1 Tax=Nocardia noduli TaxID=2815722 RepID=UPI0027E01822|nr:TetR family transcriptional regulator [Nocardia noduli]
MSADTRSRMIDAAVTALQHRGVAGMSFTEILSAAGAARGAIYHHFPGGKKELVSEAALRNGADVRAVFAEVPGESPTAVVENFLATVRPVVEASTAGGGCAVAALTVAPEDERLRQIAAGAFDSWTAALAERLLAAGVPELRAAEDLAAMLIGLLEGAHITCRAAGAMGPFEQASRAAIELVRARYSSM